MNMEIPAFIVGLFCAGALAASMSSGDAMVHASASIIVRDGAITAGRRHLDQEQQRFWIRVVVVAVLVASYAVAIGYKGSLVELLLYAYGPVGQFAPAVVATLYWRRATGAGVLAGLVGGALVTTGLGIWPHLRPFELHAGLYGFALNVATLIGVSIATDREVDGESEFLEISRGAS